MAVVLAVFVADMWTGVTLADAEIAGVVIALKYATLVPVFIGVLLSVVVDTLIDTLAGLKMGGFMAIEALVDVTGNDFVIVLTMPILSDDLSS